MHVPERQLRDYLRVFLPERDLEDELDAIAATALDEDVTDPLDLFRIAHRRLTADPRITPRMEAVVLVEEAGLPVADTAHVLGLSATEVTRAVQEAWSSVLGTPAPAVSAPEEPAPEDPHPDPAPPGAGTDDSPPEPPADEPPADEPPADEAPADPPTPGVEQADDPAPAPAPRRGRALAIGAALVLVTAFVVVVATSGRRAELTQQGLDPLAVLPVALLLILAGAGLLLLTGRRDRDRTPPEEPPSTPPATSPPQDEAAADADASPRR